MSGKLYVNGEMIGEITLEMGDDTMRCVGTKFKVGDKVRVLDAGAIMYGRKHYYDGQLTEVLYVDSDGWPRLLSKNGGQGISVACEEFHAIEKLDGGDTMKHRTVKRKARVGERILITEKTCSTMRDMSVGKAYEVVEIGHNSSYVEVIDDKFDQASAFADGYEVIVEDSDNPRITALEAEVEVLKAQVYSLEKNKADTPELSAATRKLTPNQQRKATIERAKAFVEDMKARAIGNNTNDDGNYTFNHKTTKLTFHVNAEKRVVTALAHWRIGGGPVDKAFAKCAPDDAFNADIGKAIAAGRLYGLDVSEFVNAEQPTEVVIGMRVEVRGNSRPYTNKVVAGGTAMHVAEKLNGRLSHRLIAILDDTEAQY